jgi:hypothetical protein
MKIIALILLTFTISNSFAVECTFSAKLANQKEASTIVFYDEQALNEVNIGDFKAAYIVDIENKLETLAITLPSGYSVSPQFPLNLIPTISIQATSANGDEASLVCHRD